MQVLCIPQATASAPPKYLPNAAWLAEPECLAITTSADRYCVETQPDSMCISWLVTMGLTKLAGTCKNSLLPSGFRTF